MTSFCAIYEVQNPENAITFGKRSYNKIREVYATNDFNTVTKCQRTLPANCYPINRLKVKTTAQIGLNVYLYSVKFTTEYALIHSFILVRIQVRRHLFYSLSASSMTICCSLQRHINQPLTSWILLWLPLHCSPDLRIQIRVVRRPHTMMQVKLERWQLTRQFPTWQSPAWSSSDRPNYESRH